MKPDGTPLTQDDPAAWRDLFAHVMAEYGLSLTAETYSLYETGTLRTLAASGGPHE